MTDVPVFRRETLVGIDAVTRALDLTRRGVGATHGLHEDLLVLARDNA